MENELWRKVYQIVQRPGKSKRRRGILKFNLVRKIAPYKPGLSKVELADLLQKKKPAKPFYDDKKIAD